MPAGSQHDKHLIIAAQAVLALVALLGSDQCAVQKAAAGALDTLAYDSQPSRDAIIAANALPSLVALLGSDHFGVQEEAVRALCNLAASSQQNKDAIIAAQALPALAALLRSDQSAVQEKSSWSVEEYCVWFLAKKGCRHCSQRFSKPCSLVGIKTPWCATASS